MPNNYYTTYQQHYTTNVNNLDNEATLNNAPEYVILSDDAPRNFNNRAAFHDYLGTVNDDLQRAIDNHHTPAAHHNGATREYHDPEYFHFAPYDDGSSIHQRTHDGNYLVTDHYVATHNITPYDHRARRDYYRHCYIFLCNPDTCGNRCRPTPGNHDRWGDPSGWYAHPVSDNGQIPPRNAGRSRPLVSSAGWLRRAGGRVRRDG